MQDSWQIEVLATDSFSDAIYSYFLQLSLMLGSLAGSSPVRRLSELVTESPCLGQAFAVQLS
jgi:hypothetical protein